MAIFLYGSEAWTLTKACSCRLQAFLMQCQKQLMGVRWDDLVINTYISSVIGLDIICTTIRLRCLSLLGQVARLDHAVTAWKALDLALKTKNGVLPTQDGVAPRVAQDVHGWTTLKKASLLLSTPWCVWPLIVRLGEVSSTVLCRPRVHDEYHWFGQMKLNF